jgi:DNA repair photolyase
MEIKKVLCKSVLSKSGLYDSKYSINPYRGCSNSCIYCLHPKMEILTDKGFLKISDIFNNKNNTKVITHNGNFQPILNRFRHDYNGNLITITPYCTGKKIKITPNHKILAIKRKDIKCAYSHYICYNNRKQSIRSFNGKYERFNCKLCKVKKLWKPILIPAEELIKGDFISIPISKESKDIKIILISNMLQDIKIWHNVGKGRKLSKEKIYRIFYFKKKKVSQMEISKRLNISRSTVYGYLSGKRNKSIGYTSHLLVEGNYVRFKGGKHKIPNLIKINNDFLRFVGYYLAEGCVSKYKNRPNSYTLTISFHENEKNYIKDVQDISYRLFGIKPTVCKIKEDKSIHVCISNSIISLLFSKLFGCNSHSMRLPSSFLFLPLEKQKELLKGALRGDGTKVDEPRFTTTSGDLAQQFMYILTRMRIVPMLSYSSKRYGRPSYEIRASSKFKNSFIKLWGEGDNIKEGHFFASINDKHIFIPIRSISNEPYRGSVFNLSVSNDKTYTCNLVAVSNCYTPYVLREGRKWGSFVDVKTNAPEILEKEIRKNNSGNVLISSVTDPYQPLERKYEITKKILEKLKNTKLFVSILTKSSLVLRDIDLLKQLNCEVGLTITTLNDNVRKIFEPNASSVEDRLNALKQLKDCGIKTYIFFGPMLPYISDRNIEETLKKLAELKPEKIYFDKLNIKHPFQWSKIKAVLEENYADLADKWQSAISNEEYYKELKEKIERICKNLKLNYEFCY